MATRQEPVRVRTRRRVLRAARALVAERGLEGLTMRRLALEAEVSVATVYNLIGGREDVVRAMSIDVLEEFDDAFVGLEVTDPLERAHGIVTVVLDIVTGQVPRPLVLTALADERLAEELGKVWRSADALAEAVQAMVEAGELDGVLSPEAVADQFWSTYTRYLRQWAAGVIDDRQFRAAALYALDVCLLAMAAGEARERLVAHARPLEAYLPHSPEVARSPRSPAGSTTA